MYCPFTVSVHNGNDYYYCCCRPWVSDDNNGKTIVGIPIYTLLYPNDDGDDEKNVICAFVYLCRCARVCVCVCVNDRVAVVVVDVMYLFLFFFFFHLARRPPVAIWRTALRWSRVHGPPSRRQTAPSIRATPTNSCGRPRDVSLSALYRFVSSGGDETGLKAGTRRREQYT